MGDWIIVGSSLPLWKNRSDVLCRYTPHDVPSRQTQDQFHKADETQNGDKAATSQAVSKNVSFSDEIWWEQLDKVGGHQPGKGASRSKRSIVRGRNKVDPKGKNDATFLWRGYNFLKPFTSHWQIVAYKDNFLDADSQATDATWIVTYFTATLFTEAGIDLYVRGTLSDEEYSRVLEALKTFKGSNEAASSELRALAAKMFRVPVGNV